MKRLILLASFSVLAFAQQRQTILTPKGNYYDATSDRQNSDGIVTHLSGHVIVETDGFILQADEVDVDEKSGEFTARGHVSVKRKN